ncbi:arginine/serine-rich protein 1 isoform X2 [Heterodontus francisci]|uniref:arginine/serine-rich protein 1 isoform X2 n=1 Tax=Heterodontus francisci TaxID=7792 RepID=UPI00355B7568
MVITSVVSGCGTPELLKNQACDCNLLNSVGFSWEMRDKSSYGEMNLQQRCDHVLKSDSEMEDLSEKNIKIKWGTDGCNAEEQKTENIAAGVDGLRLASPCQKIEKYERKSHSRTLGIKRSKISQSSSGSSSGSSRSGLILSSDRSRSSSVSSSDRSRSSSVSSSDRSRSSSVSSSDRSRSSSVSSSDRSQSSSVSSSDRSRSSSVSSSDHSRSSSVSSSGSSRSGSVVSLERYRSSSDDSSLASRGRHISLKRSYRRSRRAHSRSRSRSWSRSCYRRSRYRMSYQSPRRYRSPHRYRSRSRCYVPCSRSYQRPRSSLRYQRSHSRSSRSPSRLRRSYCGFACRTQPPSHRSRSRSRGRSIRLTQNEKKKLLEIAKANADKLLGKDNIRIPPSLKPASSLKNERLFTMKTNNDAVKELTRKEVLNIRSLPKKRSTVFEGIQKRS